MSAARHMIALLKSHLEGNDKGYRQQVCNAELGVSQHCGRYPTIGSWLRLCGCEDAGGDPYSVTRPPLPSKVGCLLLLVSRQGKIRPWYSHCLEEQ